MKTSSDKPVCKEKTISAIEAKLKAMEREKINFNLTSASGTGMASHGSKQNANLNTWKSRNKPYERNAQTKRS